MNRQILIVSAHLKPGITETPRRSLARQFSGTLDSCAVVPQLNSGPGHDLDQYLELTAGPPSCIRRWFGVCRDIGRARSSGDRRSRKDLRLALFFQWLRRSFPMVVAGTALANPKDAGAQGMPT